MVSYPYSNFKLQNNQQQNFISNSGDTLENRNLQWISGSREIRSFQKRLFQIIFHNVQLWFLGNVYEPNEQCVEANVRIGSDFNFIFNYQERNPLPSKKSKSPRQARRDELRLSFRRRNPMKPKMLQRMKPLWKFKRRMKTMRHFVLWNAIWCT